MFMICDSSLQIFEIGILNTAANFIVRWLKLRNPEAQSNPDESSTVIQTLTFAQKLVQVPNVIRRKHSYLAFNSVNH
jgi:hypothetical protein